MFRVMNPGTAFPMSQAVLDCAGGTLALIGVARQVGDLGMIGCLTRMG
jgi:hypothetical protein